MGKRRYINAGGKLMDLSTPKVMGILNVTPDSFYAASRKQTCEEITARARQIVDEGGDIIDIGAYSSRPGALHITAEEEMSRLRMGLEAVRKSVPEAVLSVDTFRADVARMCVEEYGVEIINDISGGDMDKDMLPTVAKLGVPYILMHIQGTPQDMQTAPHYGDILHDVILYFSQRVTRLYDLGAKDIILDPGFGFGKTLEHNYQLLSRMEELQMFGLPLLVGVSRKSMIYKLLGGGPEDALGGTIALNAISLMKGADILRVHDVKACRDTVRIFNQLKVES